jgi:hypothetical protein
VTAPGKRRRAKRPALWSVPRCGEYAHVFSDGTDAATPPPHGVVPRGAATSLHALAAWVRACLAGARPDVAARPECAAIACGFSVFHSHHSEADGDAYADARGFCAHLGPWHRDDATRARAGWRGLARALLRQRGGEDEPPADRVAQLAAMLAGPTAARLVRIDRERAAPPITAA